MKAIFAAALLWPLLAAAQSVSLAGQMGSKALLVIDGQTQMLAVGETARGVKLLSLQGDEAQVERGGKRQALRQGAAPVSLGVAGSTTSGNREIVLSAGPGGHFMTAGAINGRQVRFMVDTGATLIALGRDEATRLGIDLTGARMAMTHTANGEVPVHQVTLTSVRVGDVELANVGAVVVPHGMPFILLGNSFLTRFQMRRDNDVMRLELR
jgi:aspartyl protease family protein